FRQIPGNPVPVIVLAIDDNVRNVGGGYAGIEKLVTGLRLAGRRKKDRDQVDALIRDRMRKCKAGVPGDKKVIASVVLQLEGITGTGHQPNHRSTDGEGRLRAGNL